MRNERTRWGLAGGVLAVSFSTYTLLPGVLPAQAPDQSHEALIGFSMSSVAEVEPVPRTEVPPGSVDIPASGASAVAHFHSAYSPSDRHVASSYRSKPPTYRYAGCGSSGRLPPESIQRVVRQNFGRYRGCYQEALRAHPDFMGRIEVSFIIEEDGTVSDVAAPSNTLGKSFPACMVRAFQALSFPKPAGGVVRVTYPFVLSPDH